MNKVFCSECKFYNENGVKMMSNPEEQEQQSRCQSPDNRREITNYLRRYVAPEMPNVINKNNDCKMFKYREGCLDKIEFTQKSKHSNKKHLGEVEL